MENKPKVRGKSETYDVLYCAETQISPGGMICHKCEHLPNCSRTYLSYYARIPHFIVDNYISIMSHTAFCVFIYLCRRANFDSSSNHFGRCWLTLEDIAETTGISLNNMRKYLNELQDIGLISWKYSRVKDQGSWKTTHEFNIHHIKYLKEIADQRKIQRK